MQGIGETPFTRRGRRGSLRWAAAVGLALVAFVSLVAPTGPKPPGKAPLRYRDVDFSSVNVTHDLTYGHAPDNDGNQVALKLDLYQPAGDKVTRRPAIVYVHGGGFSHGDKSAGRELATYFAQRGFVVTSINYRLLAPPGCGGNPEPPPECVTAAYAAQHDAQAAVRWLRANKVARRIDPTRIAIEGASAGAITSLLVAWRHEDPGTSGNAGYSSAVRAAGSISGGTPTNQYITADDAPAIFFHGTEDHTVPYDWAVSNYQAMRSLGIPSVFEAFQGAGHGLVQAGYGDVIYRQSDYFLYARLDLAHAAR
jgi:acetyl esterase/lipase